MLKQATIDIIKSTVPALEVHGTDITKLFYTRLFETHPELLNIFNHANQKQGKQQTALANMVLAAAVHIDKLEAIIPAVVQVAHKHRSLGVKPEHYPVVGENLLLAIKEVLGNAATDEILHAWKEAYGVIADAFIGIEAGMYKEAENRKGGWKGFRPFIVAKKVPESDVITSFYLRPEDGKELAGFEPGQYITIRLNIPGEKYTLNRQYSLSDRPGLDYYRISVKKEAGRDGEAEGIVSGYLHENVEEGDVLDISAPAGDFVLDRSKRTPVVLISGGVGLTPTISMLNTIAEEMPEREVTFIHAAIHGGTHAMAEHVRQMKERLPHLQSYVCYERPREEDRKCGAFDREGLIEACWLSELLSHAVRPDIYLCGPAPFMASVYRALTGMNVPPAQIHYEYFGPSAGVLA